jgi:hypothetical protein
MQNALFKGNASDCKAFLAGFSDYYIYALLRPDGRPFYIGKGLGPRVFQHENEARHPNSFRSNAHKLNVIRSIWRSDSQVEYAILSASSDEADIYEEETIYIEKYKRIHEGGTLTNLAAGGGSTRGPSPISRAKHANTLGGIPENNPDRAILNEFVLAIAEMRSVVLKPTSQFIIKPTQINRKKMNPTLRQAAALAAACSASGLTLNKGVSIPRVVIIQGIEAFVENGVSCDIALSEIATLVPSAMPENERFRLNCSQCAEVMKLVGKQKCLDLGIV